MSDVDLTSDTYSLAEACRKVGIARQTGARLARAGEPLITGVRIIRIGAADSGRPVYRVAKAQLDQALGAGS